MRISGVYARRTGDGSFELFARTEANRYVQLTDSPIEDADSVYVNLDATRYFPPAPDCVAREIASVIGDTVYLTTAPPTHHMA